MGVDAAHSTAAHCPSAPRLLVPILAPPGPRCLVKRGPLCRCSPPALPHLGNRSETTCDVVVLSRAPRVVGRVGRRPLQTSLGRIDTVARSGSDAARRWWAPMRIGPRWCAFDGMYQHRVCSCAGSRAGRWTARILDYTSHGSGTRISIGARSPSRNVNHPIVQVPVAAPLKTIQPKSHWPTLAISACNEKTKDK
jgi:hypothetical protein